MNIKIKTHIEKNYQLLFPKFNKELFKALKPPLISLDVLRFDGCKSGDEVHLQMGIFGIQQKWISLITALVKNDYEIYFVDEGTLLPPPLKSWKHTHRIQKINETSSFIIDDIEFTSGFFFLDLIMFPVLYTMFYLRKPIYKRELS